MSIIKERPRPELICIGCNQRPEEIDEYVVFAQEEGITASEYVWQEEGTLNQTNGHFLCTSCYIDAGMPVGDAGRPWHAP